MSDKNNKKKHKIKHLEYNKIDKYLYIGTTICCKIHFNELLQLGIVADVDLQEEKIDNPSGVKSFLWLPTFDFTPPSQTQLIIGSHFIEDLVNHKMKCYVHCKAGHGRAPTLVAAYYILKGLTPTQAIAKIKKKRPPIHPTKSQRKALEIFYKSVNKTK